MFIWQGQGGGSGVQRLGMEFKGEKGRRRDNPRP